MKQPLSHEVSEKTVTKTWRGLTLNKTYDFLDLFHQSLNQCPSREGLSAVLSSLDPGIFDIPCNLAIDIRNDL